MSVKNFAQIRTFFVVCCLLLAFSQLSAQAWIQKQSVPAVSARESGVGFSVKEKGYFTMGTRSGLFIMDVQEYDPDTDTWTLIDSFPGSPRWGGVGVGFDSLAYVGLGFDGTRNFDFIDWYEYNPATTVWTQKASFPGQRGRNTISTGLKGKVYVGGGRLTNSPYYYDSFYEYDPALDIWRELAPFPFGNRAAGIACGLGDLVYVGCGRNELNNFNDFWAYNPNVNQWVRKTDFPGVSRMQANAVVHGNKLIVGGGFELGVGTELGDYYEYDPQTDSWSPIPGFSAGARSLSSAFTIEGTPYIVGGRDVNTVQLGDLWAFDALATALQGEAAVLTATIYPNPGTETLHISAEGTHKGGVFKLYSTTGAEIWSQPVSAFQTTVDVAALAPGTYVFRLEMDGQVAVGRWVKESGGQ